MRQKRALVVDDEPDIRDLLSITLGRMDIAVDTAGDYATAVRMLGSETYDLVLTDMRLPDRDGLEIVEWIQAHRPGVPVAVITAHGNVEAAVRALKLGAFDFISKPLDLGSLRKLIAATLRLGSDLEATGRWSAMKLHGTSKPMQQLRDLVGRVVRSQAPVHISGESGTGKELVARLIHESGARKEAPFVPVNCGAIPTELMESELFGHKKGSFTGAVADKEGLIRSAEGGTLFLDEIGDMPLALQAKLLRFLQDRTVERVGGREAIPVDVRVVCATNQDLTSMIAEQRFRQDLYYRIGEISVVVPPLRERPGGAAVLAHAFLRKFAAQQGRSRRGYTDDALQAIQTHPWPGNVRELENKVKTALIMAEGPLITAADLGLVAADEAEHALNLKEVRARAERVAVHQALMTADGNVSRASELLGITRPTLYDLMEKFGLRSPDAGTGG